MHRSILGPIYFISGYFWRFTGILWWAVASLGFWTVAQFVEWILGLIYEDSSRIVAVEARVELVEGRGYEEDAAHRKD